MKQCRVIGCENPPHARGWCGKHYQRYTRWGDPEAKDRRLYVGVLRVPIETVIPSRRKLALAGQKRFDKRIQEIKEEEAQPE